MSERPHCADDIRLGDVRLRTLDADVTWELWACPNPGRYGADVFAVSGSTTLSSLMRDNGFGVPHPATDFAKMAWAIHRERIDPSV